MIVVELKSDALKERHWKQLMKELRVSWNLSELTLGQVWDADLLRYEPAIKQVLLVAQGELALEEFLKQVFFAIDFVLVLDSVNVLLTSVLARSYSMVSDARVLAII